MKLFYTCVLVLVCQLSYSQDQWLNFTNNYTVTDVVETEEGYWLSSSGGLCYYDFDSGDETYYNRGNSEIPSNDIQDLILDSNNELWLTTSLGITKFANGTFEAGPTNLRGMLRETLDGKIIVANFDSIYVQTEGMNFETIAYPLYVAGIGGLEVDQETGAIYFNAINYFAETYIAEWENDAWTILFSEFIYESAMTLDHNNQLWLLTSEGLSYYDQGIWTSIPEVLESDAFTNMKIHVNIDNHVIIETSDECPELLKWDGTSLSDIDFTKDVCTDCQFIKPSDMDADLYFAANRKNGFYSFLVDDTNEYQPFSQSPLYYNTVMNSLHLTDDSHFLIFYNKIQQLKNGNWEEILLPDDLTSQIRSGHLDASEVLWIHDDYFLWYYENESWTKVLPPATLTDKIQLMATGPTGEIWIQSKLNIARYQDESWQVFKAIHHNITSSIIKDLQVDPKNGHLWVTSFQGIRQYDGQAWTSYTIEPNNQIFRMAISNEGVYVRSSYGLYYLEDDMIDSIPMPDEGYFGAFELNMTYDLNEEKLYLTGTNALAVYQNDVWTSYTTIDAGIYNGYSNDVRLDPMGNVWLSGNEGGVSIFNAEGVSFTSVKEEVKPTALPVKIYPTLITEGHVYLESELSGDYQILISDMIGRILFNKSMYLGQQQTQELLLPTLNRGVFLITVLKQGQSNTKRIIKID